MTASDQTILRASQSDTWEDTASSPYSDAAGLPAGANSPHVAFPPPATLSASVSMVEPGPNRAAASKSEPKFDTGVPDRRMADPQMLDTLGQVARENLIAIGAAAAQSPAAVTTSRRPLSEFVAAAPTRQETFKPALEVDAYRWPAVCEQLARQYPRALDPVAEEVREAARQGRMLIGFLGAEPQAGCTTMLLTVARRLAALGSRVAVVDADFATAARLDGGGPSLDLASQLGLVVSVGWEDVLAGRLPLAEGVIQSAAETVAVLPILRRSHSAHEALQVIQTHGIQASVTAGVLRAHYDMVLVDLGCATEQVQVSTARAIGQHCRLDATLIVTREFAVAAERLPTARLTPTTETVCLGVVENWAAGERVEG